MKNLALVAAVLAATSVSASAATTSFVAGGSSPSGSNYTVVNTFDTEAGLTGSNFQIKTPPSDGNGAVPANSDPYGTPYLSVLGGGSATYTFAPGVRAFQFDWGSVDSYNTLTVTGSNGTMIRIPGTADFVNAANGNQFLAGTNGLFTVRGTGGETFSSVTFSSSSNSFEVDNLAIGAVPEPAAWAMMIGGFGLVGGATRRRRNAVATVFA